jgi:hypothetical protein
MFNVMRGLSQNVDVQVDEYVAQTMSISLLHCTPPVVPFSQFNCFHSDHDCLLNTIHCFFSGRSVAFPNRVSILEDVAKYSIMGWPESRRDEFSTGFAGSQAPGVPAAHSNGW